MFIRLSRLTGDEFQNDAYINPNQIISFGPFADDQRYSTLIVFNDGNKAVSKKEPKEIAEMLTDFGVEVWR